MRLRQRQLSWQIKQFHHHTSLSLLSSLPCASLPSTSSSPYSQIEKARTVESANQRLPYSAVSTPASHWWGRHRLIHTYTLTDTDTQTHTLLHTYRHRHTDLYILTDSETITDTDTDTHARTQKIKQHTLSQEASLIIKKVWTTDWPQTRFHTQNHAHSPSALKFDETSDYIWKPTGIMN